MASEPNRIVLVDDHPALRRALAIMLDREPDLAVVGQAGTLAEARALLAAGTPVDAALVDLQLPDGRGTDLIRELRAATAPAAVVVLSGTATPAARAQAVAAGAVAVLDKASAGPEEIAEALRRVCAGEALLPPLEVAALLREAEALRRRADAARAVAGRITPRERAILQALAEGLGDRAMAERFSLSERTVRNQMTTLLTKLGADSRTQALLIAGRLGLVALPGPADR